MIVTIMRKVRCNDDGMMMIMVVVMKKDDDVMVIWGVGFNVCFLFQTV